ncbi:TonB-dependent siderophore receptor [Alteromonas stellipolaris]|uniref:Ferrichrome-iron receptor n=1 Tax=Alteromonas stellipolaris TaxID=233316 RepID=A0AAW7Z4W7_9ALTE|nr:TonB-dependent siderophore receptor [Alteromonas stellipolaris]ALM90103.1 Ferrichrome-iron receptor [Alteromonas stellipolaris LMG 21856]AMJ74857.1 ferrichrome-iron receptor [Alteromonas stellipolaris]AMJ95028.1 ferrichrome-iron receptor [Alteromonas stellipolaris]ANB22018.1 ferrichrome-iron receptor [Alteromonas stellipolaris]MDO6577262.1 TonB-dependent siderophore receptor [Alteromonas stellipolaris]
MSNGRKGWFYPSLTALAIAVATSPVAQEQEDESLEHIEVNPMQSYRSTATKSSLRPIDSPVSISVIDQELLQLRQAQTVSEALRYSSGVTTESRPTITIFDQFTIRGFDTYQTFYDGLPLLSNNSWNLYPQVDSFATESLEILKGPASSLYGLVPPGGMVNQVAKYPKDEDETLVRAAVGSDNLLELGVDTTGQLTDNARYRLVALGRKQDGFQDTTENERYTIAPSVTIDLTKATELTLSAYYQDDPEMVPSTPLPGVGTLYEAPYGKLDASVYAGDENWNSYSREVLMLGYKVNHEFNNDWSVLQKFRYTDADALQQNSYHSGEPTDGIYLTRSAYLTDEEIDGVTVDTQLAGFVQTGDVAHNLLFGLDYQNSDSTVAYRDTLTTDTPVLDLSNIDNDLFDVSSLPLDFYQEDHVIDIEQIGFYLQDEIRIDNFTFLLNGRYDQFESTDVAANEYAGFPYGSTTEIDQNEFSGRVAAMYTFDSGWRMYVNYSESFEPVSGTDSVTGEAFKPTTADQIEVGTKYISGDGATTFTGAYFVLTKQNVVVNTSDFAQYTQNGEVESKGVELELNTRVTNALSLQANATFLDMEVTEDTLDPDVVGKTPVWVAEESASVWANYFFDDALDGLMLGAGVRYVGETQVDKYNTDTVPSYTLIDAVLSYDMPQYDLKLTGSVSNLTDKEYVGACYDTNNCWYGAQRRFEIGIEKRF